MTSFMTPVHVYEASPSKDHRGDDLISDTLSSFGSLHENVDKAATKHC